MFRKNNKKTLSQASAEKKLLICVPVCVVSGVLAYLEVFTGITRMLAIIMAAYAIVGVIELFGGNNIMAMGKDWDALPAWKKFIYSLLVIIAAMLFFAAIAPVIIKLFYN